MKRVKFCVLGLSLLIAGLSQGSCADTRASMGPTIPEHPKLTAAGYADAETLFRGVMFGQGPIADSIPEIRDNLKVDLLATSGMPATQIVDLQNRLLARIKLNDSGFLARFKSAMNSGDQVEISMMLEEAGSQITQALRAVAEGDSLRYYDAHPSIVSARMQPRMDATGHFSLGDTAVTASDASTEIHNQISTSSGGGTSCGANGELCQSMYVLYAYRAGAIVYYVAAVHAAVVYNVVVAIAWGKYVAVTTLRDTWTADTSLLKDQIINSIAVRLAT